MDAKIKLSHLVSLHQKAIRVVEKAMLDVIWDDEDEDILSEVAGELNRLGADPDLGIEHDVPLGLGDVDALIRFGLSVYQLHEGTGTIQYENFERLFREVNEPVFAEVSREIFEEEDEE